MLQVKILTLQQIAEIMKPYWDKKEKEKVEEEAIIENTPLDEKRKQRTF